MEKDTPGTAPVAIFSDLVEDLGLSPRVLRAFLRSGAAVIVERPQDPSSAACRVGERGVE